MVTALLHPRTKGLKDSVTLAVNERSQRLIAGGGEVYKFGLGQSPFPVPDILVESLRKNAHQKDYLPVRGLNALRETVADWFDRKYCLDFNPEHILVSPGSKELLFLIQMAVDAVLILPSPSWVSYEPQSKLAGNATIWVDTEESGDWCLEPKALANVCRRLEGRTGMLLLNYPNNPTGVSYTATQLQSLAEVARKYGLLVISDEIYGGVDHADGHQSIASYYSEATIVTTGLSKWCGAGGWRLGVAAFPEQLSELANVVASLASETYTSVSAPIQYAAVKAFEPSQELDDYLARSRMVLRVVQDHVRTRLRSLGLTMPIGRGGFYLFCNFEHYREALARRGIKTSESLVEILLKETGVAVLPGSAFGRPPQELTLRLSYVDFDGDEALSQANRLSQPEIFSSVFSKIEQGIEKLATWLVDR